MTEALPGPSSPSAVTDPAPPRTSDSIISLSSAVTGNVHRVDVDLKSGALPVGSAPMSAYVIAEAARAWNESAAYREIAALRSRNTDSRRLIVEGLPSNGS